MLNKMQSVSSGKSAESKTRLWRGGKTKQIFIITLLLLISSVIRANDKPKIVFDELKYDFGKVEQGPTLEHIFKFTNDGDSVLVINSVQAGCGCTGVMMSEKKEFQPGEEGEIKVTFNTQGRAGINQKSVTVSTNDPNSMTIILTFTCDIQSNK